LSSFDLTVLFYLSLLVVGSTPQTKHGELGVTATKRTPKLATYHNSEQDRTHNVVKRREE